MVRQRGDRISIERLFACNELRSRSGRNRGTGDRFGANLRRARKEAGLNQEELGGLCAMFRTEVSLLERAGRAPRLGTLVKLVSALDVSVESLCAGMRWDREAQRFVIEK